MAADVERRSVPGLNLQKQYGYISDEIKNAVEHVIESQRFVLGREGERLEEEIAGYLGAGHAVGVGSGTDAIFLCLLALDVGPGDEVITSSYSFFAAAEMISLTGAKPVFVDIGDDFNLDPEAVDAQVNERTAAILPVHLFGLSADMDPILETSENSSIPVIEDAAQAIGAEYKGRRVGALGEFGILSFYPTKNLGGYGDSGMVLSRDQEFCSRAKSLARHGEIPGQYIHQEIGTNSRLDEIQAAVLRVKLKYLDKWNELRRARAAQYSELLAGTEIVCPGDLEGRRHVFHQFAVIVPSKRDELASYLLDRGIGVRVHYPLPLPFQECYTSLGHRSGEFPRAEDASKRSLSLPMYPELEPDDVEYVADAIRAFYGWK
jgi:dTDP-4-amino-4,6-dideoxygalactose transaminase